MFARISIKRSPHGITRRDIAKSTAIEQGYAGRACPLCEEFALMSWLRGTQSPTQDVSFGLGRSFRPRSREPLFANQDPPEANPRLSKSAAFHAPYPEPAAE
jgi:hypothetical protein